MSLLEALKRKRAALRPSTTTVTLLDGTKMVQDGADVLQVLPKQSCGYVVDSSPDGVAANVYANVFLGSQDSCCDLDQLMTLKIGYVLSVGIESPTKYDNVVYKFVQCLDLPETELNETLNECIGFFRQASDRNCGILVHCNAGVSRAPSIVIAYLMRNFGFSFDRAFSIVKKARSCIRPNDGFLKQLKMLSPEKG